MITRLEIDGFKTFEDFAIDLVPFTAIVGPNASGKSNLFDAIELLAELATEDVRSAMTKLRGEPLELFRQTPHGSAEMITLAVEALLPISGIDQFGTEYNLKTQRLRYEVSLAGETDASGNIEKVIVAHEKCERIEKQDERSSFIRPTNEISYGGNMRKTPFLDTETTNDGQKSFLIRQDGPNKKVARLVFRRTTLPGPASQRFKRQSFHTSMRSKTFWATQVFLRLVQVKRVARMIGSSRKSCYLQRQTWQLCLIV